MFREYSFCCAEPFFKLIVSLHEGAYKHWSMCFIVAEKQKILISKKCNFYFYFKIMKMENESIIK